MKKTLFLQTFQIVHLFVPQRKQCFSSQCLTERDTADRPLCTSCSTSCIRVPDLHATYRRAVNRYYDFSNPGADEIYDGPFHQLIVVTF